MESSKKILLKMLPLAILLSVFLLNSAVFGITNLSPDGAIPTESTDASMVVLKIWGIIMASLQVAAVAAVVFCGVKYMFASANEKADIKTSLMYLALGAIITFGASTFVQVITGSWRAVTGF
ncbi:MAG: hypothetical protein RSE00_03930 [Clostridia bacterium]